MLTPASFDNAVAAVLALSGSTNAVIHLPALAGRAGIKAHHRPLRSAFPDNSVLANLRPSGKYLMEDFYYAGGLPALLAALKPHLESNCRSVTGKSLGENIARAEIYNSDVIRSLDNPVMASGGLVILRGNLAPDGAVIKAAAAQPTLLKHTGPAVVFNSFDEMNARMDDPSLEVDANSVLFFATPVPKERRGCPSGATCLSRKNC